MLINFYWDFLCSSSSWLWSHQLSMTFTISISQARSMFTSLTSSWRYRNQVILGALIMSSVFCSSLVSKYFTTYNSDTCWSVVAELGTFWRSFVLFGNEKLNISTDQEEKSSQVKGSVSCGRIDCSSIWAKKCRKVFSIVTSYWKLFPFYMTIGEHHFFLLVSFPGTKGCSYEIHSYSGWPDISRFSTYDLANLKNFQHSCLSFPADQCLYTVCLIGPIYVQ